MKDDIWTARVAAYAMFRRFARLCAGMCDRIDYLATSTRLVILDRLAGPLPETATDRAIRDQREWLRQAFPQVDFDDPTQPCGGAREGKGISQCTLIS